MAISEKNSPTVSNKRAGTAFVVLLAVMFVVTVGIFIAGFYYCC